MGLGVGVCGGDGGVIYAGRGVRSTRRGDQFIGRVTGEIQLRGFCADSDVERPYVNPRKDSLAFGRANVQRKPAKLP